MVILLWRVASQNQQRRVTRDEDYSSELIIYICIHIGLGRDLALCLPDVKLSWSKLIYTMVAERYRVWLQLEKKKWEFTIKIP